MDYLKESGLLRNAADRVTSMMKAPTMSQYRSKPPDNRPSAWKRGYNSTWKKLKKWHLGKHPMCVRCLEIKYPNAGTKKVPNEVDHIIPHKGNKELLYDEDNLQTLCKSHHSHKTATEDGGFGHKKRA